MCQAGTARGWGGFSVQDTGSGILPVVSTASRPTRGGRVCPSDI